MKVSDFKVGDRLWRVDYDKKTGAVSFTPFPISKVGRKYVYVRNGCWDVQFQMHIKEDCFLEVKDWGSPEVLYFSEQDARDYVERRDCEDFLARLDSWGLRKYSLETLRKAVRILKTGEVSNSDGVQ